MKSTCTLVLLFALGCIYLAGCNKVPTIPANVKIGANAPKSDPFRAVLETFRYSETARAGEDWMRYRGGFDLLGNHFTKPDVLERIRKSSAEQRAFLDQKVRLTEEELAEVESTSFRTADAHYLDECFLLRDVAQSLEITGLSPIEQAHLHFRWVMRNVLPHEQADSWVPPAFTLRRGCGSPLDRSLLFLALLRQAQIEGCLIVVPSPEPRQFLVAVLDPKTSSLHLFDARLGMALLSKDGVSVLSLKEAVDNPSLLEPALISADDAKKLEAWLVCPLYALAPRLLELQKNLSKTDTIILHLNASEVADEIAKATKLPVSVWNPPEQGKTLPNSPTRALRRFLPKQEGGVDETNRAGLVMRTRVPFQNIMVNYAQIKMTRELLTAAPFQMLQALTLDFLNKYDLQAREMYLRGQYDALNRRNERLQLFARDEAGLLEDKNFRKEAFEWQTQMRVAYALLDDPPRRAKAQNDINRLSNDLFLRWMLDTSKEENVDRKHEKTVLTRILAVGMRDYFDIELARSQACVSHEKAGHAQATLLVLRAQQKPTKNAEARTREEWSGAKSSWSNFYLEQIALNGMIQHRLDQWNERVPINEIEQKVSLLETLHLDVQKYFHARLRLAECLEHLEGVNVSRAYLEKVKEEIESLESKDKKDKRDLLPEKLKLLSDALNIPQLQQARARLDLLARDWSATGNYFWMKRQIDQKIGPAPKK